ncbi:MAG: hypothetical protein DRR06_09440 [Gammaproteobacteria bacterium]|nr:MAG: hypothetical protein DRR06_09440 [Gammaproteobacteria bacterium]
MALAEDPRFTVVDLTSFPALDNESRAQEDDQKAANQYQHAKWIWIKAETGSILISGSANLSAPAWLAEGASKNAEAVLVLLGEGAEQATTALELDGLAHCKRVETIKPWSVTTAESPATGRGGLLLVPFEQGEYLPLDIPSTEQLKIWYELPLERREMLALQPVNGLWNLKQADLREGRVLMLQRQDGPLQALLLHALAPLRERTLTGDQQKFKLALGALQSSSPDMKMLFTCLEKILKNNADPTAALRGHSSREPKITADSEDGGSLIVELEGPVTSSSGPRLRAARGDLAQMLDAVIQATRDRAGLSNTAFGEDDQGRNEEELIDSDDESGPPAITTAVISNSDEVAFYCQRRCKALVRNIRKMVGGRRSGEEKIALSPHVLVCISLVHQLYGYRLSETQTVPCVAEETLGELEQLLFSDFFNEKQKLVVDENDCLEAIEEYGQLLAYATWLVFVTGKQVSPALSLSSTLDEHEVHNQGNAILIFLAQRLLSMPRVHEMVADLLTDFGEQAQRWLAGLYRVAEQLRDNKSPASLAGHLLARSSNGGYVGICLAKEQNEKSLRVVQMAKSKGYLHEFLSLVGANSTPGMQGQLPKTD